MSTEQPCLLMGERDFIYHVVRFMAIGPAHRLGCASRAMRRIMDYIRSWDPAKIPLYAMDPDKAAFVQPPTINVRPVDIEIFIGGIIIRVGLFHVEIDPNRLMREDHNTIVYQFYDSWMPLADRVQRGWADQSFMELIVSTNGRMIHIYRPMTVNKTQMQCIVALDWGSSTLRITVCRMTEGILFMVEYIPFAMRFGPHKFWFLALQLTAHIRHASYRGRRVYVVVGEIRVRMRYPKGQATKTWGRLRSNAPVVHLETDGRRCCLGKPSIYMGSTLAYCIYNDEIIQLYRPPQLYLMVKYRSCMFCRYPWVQKPLSQSIVNESLSYLEWC